MEKDPSGLKVTVTTYQPVFAHAFQDHDRLTGIIKNSCNTFERFSLDWQCFLPETFLDPLGFDIDLPLREVPVFKLKSVQATLKPYSYARGLIAPAALCSIVYSFMPDVHWIWPDVPSKPRMFVNSPWSYHRGRTWPRGEVKGWRVRSMDPDYSTESVDYNEKIIWR